MLQFITHHTDRYDEIAGTRAVLEGGCRWVQLRMKDAPAEEVRRIGREIEKLCREYGIGGVHLNARNPEIPAGFGGLISRACHSFEELASHPTEDYLFLSPIFDSISKTGYRAGYAPDELRKAFAQGIINPRVAALGGIRPEHLPALQEYGFGGAAFLGYIWQGATPEELVRRMREIRKFNR